MDCLEFTVACVCRELECVCVCFLSPPLDKLKWSRQFVTECGVGTEAARPPPPALYLSLSPHTWPFWEALAGVKWPDGGRGEERQAGCWFSFRRSALPAGLSETEINTAGAAIYKPPPPPPQTQFQPLPVSPTLTSRAPYLHWETWLQLPLPPHLCFW